MWPLAGGFRDLYGDRELHTSDGGEQLKKTYRIKLDFDAAHFLQGYPGPCANMHGHTWHVEFYVSVPEQLDTIGIGVDFKDLKVMLKGVLPDHTCLNSLPGFTSENPTAELLVERLFDAASDMIDALCEGLSPERSARVEKVVLWETEKNGIEATRS